jgi:hypothetical protein
MGDPRKPSDNYSYDSKFHVTNAMNLPGPGAFALRPVLGAMPIAASLIGVNLPDRTLNFGCFGGTSVEEFVIHLPKNARIVALPKDVHLTGSIMRYNATYASDGNTISVLRKLEDSGTTNLCTPVMDKELRPMQRSILKDLQAQVIYQ